MSIQEVLELLVLVAVFFVTALVLGWAAGWVVGEFNRRRR